MDTVLDLACVGALAFFGCLIFALLLFWTFQLATWVKRRIAAWRFARRPWPVEKV
jgi:hypothetical protein